MPKEKAEKAVVVKSDFCPAEMIRLAVSGGADLDKLEKLLTIQERWEANEAKKAYNKAIAAFKANPPKIEKDKKVGYTSLKGGKVAYSHASLYNVVDKITAELSKHGLSASWRTQQTDKITVTCRISHALGHSEETSISANADDSGSKNSIQAIGSTITYLERYSLLALTGLSTYDQDTDGIVPEEKIDENKIKILRESLQGMDESKFLAYMGVKKMEDIPMSEYAKAKIAIEARRKTAPAKPEGAGK